MKKFAIGVLLALAGLGFTGLAAAADKATADEALALVKRATAFMKANGKDKALAEFNNPKGQFVDRELYIFAIDQTGLTVANGANSKLVGKNVLEMKDTDGKPFIKSFIELGNTAGKGWVDYRWSNPASGKMEMKSTYIERSGDILIGCGIYK